jgi:hypothetical protein
MGAALGQMARLVLDHGLAAGSSGGFRPHLSVHVSWDTLVGQVAALSSAKTTTPGRPGEDGVPSVPAGWDAAVLADGTPIPPSVLARLACDSEVSRVIFGPDSQVLDVGRAERLYTRALRRAVVARDAHCSYPGCYQSPRRCEVHHVRHWAAHGGETSIGNGVLLCWWHHDVTHRRHLTIHRNRARARWEFYERDGTPIRHPGGPPGPQGGPSPMDEAPGAPGGKNESSRDVGLAGGRPGADQRRDINPADGRPRARGRPAAPAAGENRAGQGGETPDGSLGESADGRGPGPGLVDVARVDGRDAWVAESAVRRSSGPKLGG